MKLVVTLTIFCASLAVAAPAKKTKINAFKIYNSCPTTVKAVVSWQTEASSPWQTSWFSVEPNTQSHELQTTSTSLYVYAEDGSKKNIWQGDCNSTGRQITETYCGSQITLSKNEYADYILNLSCS